MNTATLNENMKMASDKQLYWLKFSNGDVVKNVNSDGFKKPENRGRPFRIIVSWGTMRDIDKRLNPDFGTGFNQYR